MSVAGVELADRVAIVTGAGRSVGAAVALAFAARGAITVVNDLDASAAEEVMARIRADGGIAEVAAGDALDAKFVNDLAYRTADRHGRLDIVHCNVGYGPSTPLLELTDDQWQRALAVNLTSAFVGVRAALRVMVPQRSGSVICTSSLAGLLAIPGTAAYAAAKAGVVQLVRSAAVEYGAVGVRVNAIAPGTVRSPAFEAWTASAPERRAELAAAVPQGRLAEPSDIAAVACWLASDAAGHVNGVTIPVDGGTSARLAVPVY